MKPKFSKEKKPEGQASPGLVSSARINFSKLSIAVLLLAVIYLSLSLYVVLKKEALPVPAPLRAEVSGQPYYLRDEEKTPEGEAAQAFFESLLGANNILNSGHGSLGIGPEGLTKAYSYFSKKYRSQVTEKDFLDSFGDYGGFMYTQLYSADRGIAVTLAPGGKEFFFEIKVDQVLEGSDSKEVLFLGGEPLRSEGTSSQFLYGYLTLAPEEGEFKVDRIEYHREFALGGGHQPWRGIPEWVAQMSMGEAYVDQSDEAKNCKTREVHHGRLVYVTCTDKGGKNPKTAKMVQLSADGDSGWISIEVHENP